MSDILTGVQQPAIVGGPFISTPTAPMRAFIGEVGAIHHPTSAELFDKMYRHNVATERQVEAALMYLGHLGLVAKLKKRDAPDAAAAAATAAEQTPGADGGADDVAPIPFAPAPSAAAGAATPFNQQTNFTHITLLEENLLATRAAMNQLLDGTGEHRTPIVTNAVLLKKSSERLTEAHRIAMARGLVRKMNDNVDVKGNQQVVGEVNKVDVGRIEREREEILKLMDGVKERHEAFLNA